MRLVANSYEPEELNRYGMGMYVSDHRSRFRELCLICQNEFKPEVVEWGQRGFLQCAKILDQAKGPVQDEIEGPPDDLNVGPTTSGSALKPVESGASHDTAEVPDSPLSEVPDPAEPDHKKLKEDASGMTLEEYEAMLDAEAENGEGGYLEAGDILDSKPQDA